MWSAYNYIQDQMNSARASLQQCMCSDVLNLAAGLGGMLKRKSYDTVQLCSTRYTAVQFKSCLKSTFVIEVTTIKNMNEGSHHVLPPNRHFSLSAKITGT